MCEKRVVSRAVEQVRYNLYIHSTVWTTWWVSLLFVGIQNCTMAGTEPRLLIHCSDMVTYVSWHCTKYCAERNFRWSSTCSILISQWRWLLYDILCGPVVIANVSFWARCILHMLMLSDRCSVVHNLSS